VSIVNVVSDLRLAGRAPPVVPGADVQAGTSPQADIYGILGKIIAGHYTGGIIIEPDGVERVAVERIPLDGRTAAVLVDTDAGAIVFEGVVLDQHRIAVVGDNTDNIVKEKIALHDKILVVMTVDPFMVAVLEGIVDDHDRDPDGMISGADPACGDVAECVVSDGNIRRG